MLLRPRSLAHCLLPAALLFAACTGSVGDGVDRGGAPDPSDAGAGGSVSTACLHAQVQPGSSPLRRLTAFEYDNTVRDLLGDATQPGLHFPSDPTVNGFDNNATALSVSQLLAQAYLNAAEALAATAVTKLATLLPCDPSTVGQDACASRFITQFGRRAYRRPLTASEVQSLTTLYSSSKAQWGFTTAIQLVIEAMLESPNFLYRPDFGEPATEKNGVVELSSYERASRLSYLLWGSMPDDALLDAAASNRLSTPDEVAAQATRMLADPKAAPAIAQFHLEWLGVTQAALTKTQKVSSVYPRWSTSIATLMQQETKSLVQDVVVSGDGTLGSLLSAPYTFANKTLADYYGLKGPAGPELVKVPLDGTKYSGVLTQGAVMSVNADPNGSSPILRGKFIRLQMLCQPPPPPPPNVKVAPPAIDGDASTRERFQAHDTNPACAGCHKLMDPIGFGFENFDGAGVWRTSDNGRPVDSSGDLESTDDANGAFAGAAQLGAKLAKSRQVQDCYTLQYFRWAFARAEEPSDACTLEKLNAQFHDSNGDIRKLLVAFTRTDAFLYRSKIVPGQ